MTLEKFNEIKKGILEHINITDSNIESKLLLHAKMSTKYLAIFTEESLLLSQLKTDLEAKYGQLYMDLKTNSRYDLKVAEIEYNINFNAEYVTLKKSYIEQESYVKFIEGFVGILKNLNYSLKSYVDLKIWLSGGR